MNTRLNTSKSFNLLPFKKSKSEINEKRRK